MLAITGRLGSRPLAPSGTGGTSASLRPLDVVKGVHQRSSGRGALPYWPAMLPWIQDVLAGPGTVKTPGAAMRPLVIFHQMV